MNAPTQRQAFNTLDGMDFSSLSPEMLEVMREGMHEMLAVLEEATAHEYHILANVLATKSEEPFTQWQHYPPGDVHDRETGALWFYHAHEEDLMARPWEEHGHFHLFAYSEHAGKEVEPIALPDEPDEKNGGLCHLVAVSFSNEGVPIQVFTVNRWVAMEWMYPAETVISMLDKFRIEQPIDGRETLNFTSRWLTALLKLYRPQIEWALRERDSMIARLRAQDPDGWSEDDEIEVLSAVKFDLADQIDRLEAALAS